MNVGEIRFPVTFIRNEDGIRVKSNKGKNVKKKSEEERIPASL
jgi:hypothetical protein